MKTAEVAVTGDRARRAHGFAFGGTAGRPVLRDPHLRTGLAMSIEALTSRRAPSPQAAFSVARTR